jgi:homoserine dehydrogenase
LTLNTFQTSGNSPGAARCRVGLLGFGTVGAALARRLTAPDSPSVPQLQLTHICDRRAREKRARETDQIAALHWSDRFDDLLTSDTDIIVEAVSAGEPAFDYVRAALLAGKSVVSANKLVVAHHAPALQALAERQGRQFRFEAAVGGTMPIVRTLDGMAGERIRAIDAILSGSSNAVVSKMDETGCSMDDAIADACAHGYAEGDPTADLDGADAAAKLAIVCGLGLGLRVLPDQIDARTAGRLTPDDFHAARQRGGTIRQIAHADYDPDRSTLTVWVAPVFVGLTSIFARTDGPRNTAIIAGVHAGDVVISGAGAGGDAVAVAAIGDLALIARDRAAIVPAPRLANPDTILGLSDLKFAEAV